MTNQNGENSAAPNPTIKLSKINRLGMSFAHDLEFSRDPSLFDKECYERLRTQHTEAVTRRDRILRSLIMLDFILLLIINGSDFPIPGFDIKLLDLPAVLEAVGSLASFSAFFVCIAIVNEQSYLTILQQFAIRRAVKAQVDPDFVLASDVFQELFLKATAHQMNHWKADIYIPGQGFRVYFGVLKCLTACAISSIGIAHAALMGAAIYKSLQQSGLSVLSVGFTFVASVMFSASLLLLVGLFRSFDFTMNLPQIAQDMSGHEN